MGEGDKNYLFKVKINFNLEDPVWIAQMPVDILETSYLVIIVSLASPAFPCHTCHLPEPGAELWHCVLGFILEDVSVY